MSGLREVNLDSLDKWRGHLPWIAEQYRRHPALADDLIRLAPQVSCPVRFLVQWDDEIVPRDGCIELFGALGTKKKTMHVNPGLHSAVPQFEVKASVEYLDRYLA